jgi:fibronectin type 3 domain-containing protein
VPQSRVALATTSGLVAAYGFNEGSGTTVTDASGNGNNGTITNVTWSTAGKFGDALSFNGTSAVVTIPNSASLQLSSGMTLEAWVNPSTVNANWRDVVYKGNDNYYLEATSTNSSRPDAGTIAGGSYADAFGTAALTKSTWTHLAETYDGSTLRLYVNGTQVASTAHTGAIATSTSPLQIGGDSIYGQFFAGLIDEVRVYNVALTAAQIQSDETTPITSTPDTTPPSQPGTLAANAVSGSEVDISWGASTDNVGVTGYSVERCQAANCTNFAQVATVSGTTTSYKDTGLSASTNYSYRVRATDAAGNFGSYSNTASATTSSPDTTPPSQPGTLSASAVSGGEVDLGWGASTDNVGVTSYLVERCQSAGCTNFAQIATVSGTTTSYKDTTVSGSTSYSYRVRAADAAGNDSQYSNTATAGTPAAPSGLVAAYAFNEGSGTSVTDSSGNGNNGTVASATWSTAGKYGDALSFNGTSSLVTIPDSTSLHLSSGMTLEAWVNPSTVNAAWRDVIYKANDNFYLEATSTNSSRPDGGLIAGGSYADAFGTAALAANTWAYLTETYDGSTLRLYVNGTQVASTAHTGAITTSTNPLQIGGDSLYGQFFAGLIDEVRVYNVARTAAQIQTDEATPIGGPTAPTNLSASAVSTSEVDLSWGASTDSLGVTGYRVERCQGAACTSFTQIATPTGTTYADTGLTANTSYSYRVRAIDSAGNLGAYSNIVTASTASNGMAVSPQQYAITPGLTEQYSATVPNGSPAPTWSVDGISGGNATVGTISSSGVYTAPTAAGSHTITATSGSTTGTAKVYVTNYAGTFTSHNDNGRTGQNLNETVLTPSNVNTTTFGKLFSYPLDGLSFSDPLYVENVTVPGQGVHNVVYVATEHDSIYAFDADGRTSTPLWKDSFINPAAGVNPIPPAVTGETQDIPNEIGISGTPVIDPSTNTLYLVAATQEVSGGTTKYVNRLHAIDLSTGAEKDGGPVVINPTVPGTGIDASGGMIPFNNIEENQRASLLLSNGEVYVAFANHGNNPPYHGWVIAYNASTLHQDWAFCSTPNADKGGVWMGGGGLTADSSGNLFFSTGNGTFDENANGGDYGDTLVKLSSSGAVSDWFTPYNYAALDSGDVDLASGGVILLPDQAGAHPHEVIADGKGGTLYLVDRDNMGHVGTTSDSQIVQSDINVFPTGGSFNTGNYSKPTYFNGKVYFAPVDGPVMAFDLTNGKLSTAATSQSSAIYNGKTSTFSARGGETSISASGSSNGILWALQSNGDSLPGTLHAYDPSNLANEYWNSDQAGTRDQLDPWLKFTAPLVANGRVYVVSQGKLTAFGLLP